MQEYAQALSQSQWAGVTAPQMKTYAEDEPQERANIVKEFEWATTELASVIAELQDRLIPVLRPDYPDTAPGGTPMPEVSAARSQLHNLHGLTASLRTLVDRLEV